jgi:pilus assembly protein CpaE
MEKNRVRGAYMTIRNLEVGLEVRDGKVRDEIRGVISSIQGFSIRSSSGADSCDILVYEIGDNLKNEFQKVSNLLKSGLVKEIFLTSSCIEPEVLLQAMRSGAREFFPLPLNREEMVGAFMRLKERTRTTASPEKCEKKGKIINIIGSKGGIGTTTVAVNFASSLQHLQNSRKSVALIDMNLLFGEIPLFLDIEPVFNWGEVAKNISRLDSTYLMSVLSRHPSGMYVLPSPALLDNENPATPAIIERLLNLMKQQFDFIVIDSGQSIDEISLKLIELSDFVLINSILSLPCLVNVKRLIDTFKSFGYPDEQNVKVVVNRYQKNSAISLKDAEKGLEKRIFWTIPNDYQTAISSINQGKTLATVSRNSEIAQSFREIASKFTETPEVEVEKRSRLNWRFMEAKT